MSGSRFGSPEVFNLYMCVYIYIYDGVFASNSLCVMCVSDPWAQQMVSELRWSVGVTGYGVF